jgi:hypothetical protein
MGEISTELPPGEYTIYASTVRNGIPMSVMKRVALSYGSDLVLRPLPLAYSASIFGGMTSGGSRVDAKVTVTAPDLAKVEGSYSGSYSVIVPVGNYTVRGEMQRSEFGMDITYSDTEPVNASTDSRTDLRLDRENHYSVTMDWDNSQKQTLRQGEKTSSPYVVTVENLGNAVDKYTFSGSPTDWNYTISPSEMTLEPGNGINRGRIYVSFQATWNTPVDHPSLILTAKSKNSDVTSTKGLQVDIVQAFGVQLSKKSAVFNESNASITVEVKNTGNGDDNYTLKIINSKELYDTGWEVKFKSGNTTKDTIYQVVKFADGKKEVALAAKPIIANPKTYVNVDVMASSVKGGASNVLSFELSLPDAQPVDVKAYGKDIFMIAQNTFGPWVPLIAAIPICLAIIIFVYFLAKHGYRGLVIAVKRSFRPRRR